MDFLHFVHATIPFLKLHSLHKYVVITRYFKVHVLTSIICNLCSYCMLFGWYVLYVPIAIIDVLLTSVSNNN